MLVQQWEHQLFRQNLDALSLSMLVLSSVRKRSISTLPYPLGGLARTAARCATHEQV